MAKITTITNPLTGQPAQVDQLDHTAQQIDDAVALAPQISNPNLLDNWYFANPVNQRGQTEYTGAGYGIDRWKLYQSAVTIKIQPNGIAIKRTSGDFYTILQYIEDYEVLAGKTVTFSMLVKNAPAQYRLRVMTGSTTVAQTTLQSAGTVGIISLTTTLTENLTDLWVSIYTSTSDDYFIVEAAKLELGNQQTLAHQENGVWQLNEIPDYGEQLARCQRYFQLYSSADLRPAKAVDCRPTMRADPSQSTIVVNSTTYYYNTADL